MICAGETKKEKRRRGVSRVNDAGGHQAKISRTFVCFLPPAIPILPSLSFSSSFHFLLFFIWGMAHVRLVDGWMVVLDFH